VNQEKHKNDGNQLKKDRTDCDIMILFESFIKPFYTDQVKKHGAAAD